jgi:hypothetical protein
MTALLEFQRTFAKAVMQPLSARDNMKRGVEPAVELVKRNSRLSSFERLEIYNRSYWSRVLDAFSEDFPGVRASVGAKTFDRLRRRYLADCPSQSFTMRDLGKHLASWMERNPALVGDNFDIALEMAKLEWAEIESFDAAEDERLSPEDVAAIDPEHPLPLQPHLRLLEVRHEVDRLLLKTRETAKRNQGVTRGLTPKQIEDAKSAEPLYLAIHRHELVVHYKRLDAEMFRLLRALLSGGSMGDAVEFAYSESTLSPAHCQQHIQDTFALFASLGWFCKGTPTTTEEPQ